MSVVYEIAAWANEQADWVSDAVSRLFLNGTLSAADAEDMAALVKIAHGIEDPQKRTAKKLNLATQAGRATANITVSLTAIRAPKNINAINSPDGIAFEPSVLTPTEN